MWNELKKESKVKAHTVGGDAPLPFYGGVSDKETDKQTAMKKFVPVL